MHFWAVSARVHKVLHSSVKAIGPWGFTVAGIACLALYFKPGQLAKLDPVRDLQLAVGALVGTVLTLGFSLSIIPLQRASEVYSPSILRLFREHLGIRVIFVSLLAICFLCFAATASPVFGLQPARTVPLVLALLGISLDLLRRLYTLITQLLEPQEAVKRLSDQAHQLLIRFHENLVRACNMAWQSLPAEEKNKHTPEAYLTYAYEQSPDQNTFVRARSTELAEIAQKAIARNDWSLVLVTLNAMQRLTIDAIECRRSTLVFYPAAFMVVKATAEKPLDRVYEDLLSVNRAAIRQGAENVSMMVIRTLGRIAEHMTTIHRPRPMEHSAPLAPSPIWYCREVIKEAQGKGMDEAGNEGSATLARISCAAPANTSMVDVHVSVIDGIFEALRRRPNPRGNVFYLREPLNRALEVLHALVDRKDFYADRVTAHFLRNLTGC